MNFQELMEYLKKKFSITIFSFCKHNNLDNFSLIDDSLTTFSQRVLYIGYSHQLSPFTVYPENVLLINDFDLDFYRFSNLAFVSEAQLFPLINELKLLFEKPLSFDLFSQLIHSASQEKDMRIFINIAATALGNSIIFLDSSYKVIAFSTVFSIEDAIWKQIIEQGFCDYYFISDLNELDNMKYAPNSFLPIEITNAHSPLRTFCSKVVQNNTLVGRIILLEKETPVSTFMMEQLKTVNKAVTWVLNHYRGLLPIKTDYEHLLYQLLIGTPIEPIQDLLSHLTFAPSMRVLFLKPIHFFGKHYLEQDLEQNLEKELSAIFPSVHLVVHENGFAALIPAVSYCTFDLETTAALEALATHKMVRIGISNVFFNITSLLQYYHQAYHALLLNDKLTHQDSLIYYEDYQFYDFLDHIKNSFHNKAELGRYCHPALTILNMYDQQNKTDFYHTLQIYLKSSCSSKETAKLLFIHRNSLSYRLDRICQLTGINFSNSNTIFLLELSFRIDAYIEHGS